MAEINREILIDAPLEEIFAYIIKPSNLLEIWPSLMQIKEEKSLPNGGYSFNWTYKMSGMYLEGTGKQTDIYQNQWIITETKGAIDSKMTWTFRSYEKQTRVTFTVQYRVPLPLINRLAEKIVTKMNEQEAELILVNLRARFMEPYISR